MEPRVAEIDNDLNFDDELTTCAFAVCITGLNADGSESTYFKLVDTFNTGEEAITAAWQVSIPKDAPKNLKSFLVTVEEAVQSDEDPDEFDFVGTIFKTELVR